MTQYFFNIYNDDVTMDDEGAELADDHAAHAYAVKSARALAADTVLHGHFFHHHYIEITNEAHEVIGKVRFDEAVTIKP
ncbi:MAG: hypothetical protein JWQ16_2055 [Novosphingobium sp.]|nr:hypothetical protein [Novosphingobium sp.]